MPVYALGSLTPTIHPQSWIAPDASVIGQVQLERNVSIWWNCVLRGDTDLLFVGENTNIQDGSVLHTDPGLQLIIGRDVTIGHRVILHGCTIGDGCLIGMGATLLNRAVIGKNCLIGANTLITENKEIPDGSMVMGSPGKVVRPLTPPEIQMLALSAQHYVHNAKRYRAELAMQEAPVSA